RAARRAGGGSRDDRLPHPRSPAARPGRRPRGGRRARPFRRADRGPPRGGLSPLRLPQGPAGLAGGRAGSAATVPDGGPGRHPAESVRPGRFAPVAPLAGAGGRRHALVPAQGGRGSGPGRRPPPPAQPAALRRCGHVTPLPLVLVGGGGHASDVLQAVEAVNAVRATYQVVGVLDDDEVDGRRFAGRGVDRIGSVEDVLTVDAAYVLCLGWPWTRHAVARR